MYKRNRGDHHRLKDHRAESNLFKRRVVVSGLILISLISLLGYRFYELQITNYESYATQSDLNRLQIRPVAPTRGLFFDSKNRIVAENRAVSILAVTVELVDDLDTTLTELEKIISLSDREKTNFYRALKWRRRPYQAVPLKYNLSEEEQAKIAVNEYRLDGIEVQGRLVRYYPYSDLFSHVLGYVGRINERELQSFNEEDTENYEGTDSIGKIGLEKFYESVLLGRSGREKIETNARGRVLQVVDSGKVAPVSGSDVELFLDIDVQRAALDAMAGRRGAVVALDVETGGVVTLLSTPSYDPNLFVTGISETEYSALQGIKPMLGLGALSKGVITASTKVADPGFYQLENDERVYRDWKRGGHGAFVDIHQAIVESCDVFFYDMGWRMGVDRMHSFGLFFGLGQKTNIDIPSERRGLWPSREWKKESRGLHWFPGNSLNMSIGQGFVLTTPLQLAQMTATLARQGEFIEPRLAQKVSGVPTIPVKRESFEGEQQHWDLILDSMKDVVHSIKGTAHVVSKDMPYFMAGKTGTAQVVGIAQDEEYDSEALSERNRDHALFVGFAPYENPKIAVAVVIENGEKSSRAGMVARAVMSAYLDGEPVGAKRLAQ